MNILDLVPWYVWAVAGLVAVFFVYRAFGSKAALASLLAVAGVVFAKLIRKDAQNDAEHRELKDEVRNTNARHEATVRADQAGDAARDVPADELRAHDPFER